MLILGVASRVTMANAIPPIAIKPQPLVRARNNNNNNNNNADRTESTVEMHLFYYQAPMLL